MGARPRESRREAAGKLGVAALAPFVGMSGGAPNRRRTDWRPDGLCRERPRTWTGRPWRDLTGPDRGGGPRTVGNQDVLTGTE